MKSAEAILASIAESEAVYRHTPEAFSGFVRKVTATRVDFHWKPARAGKPDEMTVNRHGVVCSRTIGSDGRTWYGYTLDPFGEEVPYGVECEVAKGLLQRVIGAASCR